MLEQNNLNKKTLIRHWKDSQHEKWHHKREKLTFLMQSYVQMNASEIW